MSLITDRSQPRKPTERAKISGSIVGEATQKAITGARGTPAIKSPATSGMTVQEQNGLNAPTAVARSIETPTRWEKALRIAPSSSSALMSTPSETLSKNTGSIFHALAATNTATSNEPSKNVAIITAS